MNDKTLTVTVVGRRCVYINDYRVAGSKPYVSENLPSWSFEADINDLRYAIGRRPSSANKALQSRIEALEAALREVFMDGHSEGWTGNQTRRDVQHIDAEKGWSLYVSNGALEKTIIRAALEETK